MIFINTPFILKMTAKNIYLYICVLPAEKMNHFRLAKKRRDLEWINLPIIWNCLLCNQPCVSWGGKGQLKESHGSQWPAFCLAPFALILWWLLRPAELFERTDTMFSHLESRAAGYFIKSSELDNYGCCNVCSAVHLDVDNKSIQIIFYLYVLL